LLQCSPHSLFGVFSKGVQVPQQWPGKENRFLI